MATTPVVLLLHDQLMDARIWGGFPDTIAAHARPLVIPVEQRQTAFFPTPASWTAYLSAQVRPVLAGADPVDLTLAIGWSAHTALDLVDAALSRRALLIDPQPAAPLMSEEEYQAALDGITPELAADPRSQAPHPDLPSDYVAEHQAGVIGPAALDYFMEVGADSPRGPGQRLIEEITRENMTRLLPISLAEMNGAVEAFTSDWLPAAVRLADRCAVAFSDLPSLHESTRRRLEEGSPAPLIVEWPPDQAVPWLEHPHRVDDLIRRLLSG